MNRTLESALRSKYNFRKQCTRKETNELYAQGYSFFKRKYDKEVCWSVVKQKLFCNSIHHTRLRNCLRSFCYAEDFFLAQKEITRNKNICKM